MKCFDSELLIVAAIAAAAIAIPCVEWWSQRTHPGTTPIEYAPAEYAPGELKDF